MFDICHGSCVWCDVGVDAVFLRKRCSVQLDLSSGLHPSLKPKPETRPTPLIKHLKEPNYEDAVWYPALTGHHSNHVSIIHRRTALRIFIIQNERGYKTSSVRSLLHLDLDGRRTRRPHRHQHKVRSSEIINESYSLFYSFKEGVWGN